MSLKCKIIHNVSVSIVEHFNYKIEYNPETKSMNVYEPYENGLIRDITDELNSDLKYDSEEEFLNARSEIQECIKSILEYDRLD